MISLLVHNKTKKKKKKNSNALFIRRIFVRKYWSENIEMNYCQQDIIVQSGWPQ